MNSTILHQDEQAVALQAWTAEKLKLPGLTWEPLVGDASFRRYFRLQAPVGLLAVHAPPASENNEGFVKIAHSLKVANVHVPDVLAFDLKHGFLLITDLGKSVYSTALTPQTVDTLYGQALDVLAHMQTIQTVSDYDLQHFDDKVIGQELLHFQTWFLEGYLGINFDKTWQSRFDEIMHILLASAAQQPQVFMHRDYHSRNLLVCEQQTPGVLDFQDAMLGPITYDAVSLLRDAYVDWPREQVLQWADTFYDRISVQQNTRNFSRADFYRAFNLMGIQRHLKAIFIFARKFLRDGTSAYLKDIPRCMQYVLQESADYPELKYLHELMIQSVIPAWEQKNQ